MLSNTLGNIARIFSNSMSTHLAFFYYSFSFHDYWLFMVYRRFAFTPTNQKAPLFEWHWFQCYVPRLIENQCLRAIGMIQPGLAQNIVARHFWVHRNTIQSKLRQSGNTRDRQRSGRPRMTSGQQDNHIRLVHLRDWFQTSNLTARSITGLRPISSRAVRNILRDRHIRPWRPAIRQILLPRLTWCRRHLRFTSQDSANSLFTEESRFHFPSVY